jgi:hypothetical protein
MADRGESELRKTTHPRRRTRRNRHLMDYTRSSAITMLTAHEEHVRNFGVDTAISTMSGR